MDKENKKAIFCTQCGTRIVKSLIPAEGYASQGFSMYSHNVMDKYNEEGKLQYIEKYECQNYGEKTKGFFKKEIPHDKHHKKVKGFNYSTHTEFRNL
jgi:hypothetical protein